VQFHQCSVIPFIHLPTTRNYPHGTVKYPPSRLPIHIAHTPRCAYGISSLSVTLSALFKACMVFERLNSDMHSNPAWRTNICASLSVFVCVVWCFVWVQGLQHVWRRKFSIETHRSVKFMLEEGMKQHYGTGNASHNTIHQTRTPFLSVFRRWSTDVHTFPLFSVNRECTNPGRLVARSAMFYNERDVIRLWPILTTQAVTLWCKLLLSDVQFCNNPETTGRQCWMTTYLAIHK
jgi:hypothetical protein